MDANVPIISPDLAIPPVPRSICFMQVRSGACVDLLAPDLRPVTLVDIATSLSRLPRFLGATRGPHPYSVAQHSVHVAELAAHWGAPPRLQLAALFHDAAEALTGDIPTPLKLALGEPFRRIERALEDAVRRRWRITHSLRDPMVTQCDEAMLATERRDLLAESAWSWPWPAGPLPGFVVTPWPSSVAHARWMSAAHALGTKAGVEMERSLEVVA